ncbi:MAG TPA: methyltransferase domain-containing protein [Candidatus Parcubacteria bacterium]|nr:methyltransferase domain-containing protein [Candidatus Parcubacteria bacterium]
MKKENINNIILKPGSVLQIPFADNFFDSIISVSTMEHIAKLDKDYSLDKTFSEIKRVLEPGGVVILSCPVRNIITDYFYKLVGYSPRDIHPSSHIDIIDTAKKYFEVKKILKFPDFLSLNFSLYCSILCKK